MRSLWSDSEAESFVARYGETGVSRDLALRVYTTRLLGSDPRLVLHGGGNSSVKTTMRDLLGEAVEVLCVKGSGWDMGNIEPAGLPAVRLAPLRQLRQLERLADEDMVNLQRGNLIDSAAPNPSVETLLHAFLPAKFVDHTHATAVLALTDQPEGEALCREVYDGRMALVPYIMPGFALARKAAEIYERDPRVEGLILLKHGIFTLGATAREAYERMIAMVTLAEERLTRGRRTPGSSPGAFAAAALPSTLAPVSEVAPMLRGLCALSNDRASGIARRQILDFRGATPEVMNYVNGAELSRYSQIGVVTPDHTIRTKNWPLLLPPPEAGRLREWRDGPAAAAVAAFERRYLDYFRRHNAAQQPPKTALDAMPRIVLVPGLGLFGLGASKKDAAIAADIALNTIAVITDAEAIGRYECVSEADMFDVEYWSLEQAKLGEAAGAPGRHGHRRRQRHRRGDGGGDGARRRGSRIARPRARCGEGRGARDRRRGLRHRLRRHRCGTAARRVRPGLHHLRRRRHRRLQCRRGVAGQRRRSRRCDPAPLLRAQFLRASERGAARGQDHARAGHRRLPALQHLEAGGQSGARFRPLRI